MNKTTENRPPSTTAREELIGKALVRHDKPARVIGVNRSEAGQFYVVETYDSEGEPVSARAVAAETINRAFDGF